MLQIASGKFFETSETYRHEGQGILFGSYDFAPFDLVTPLGTLRRSDNHGPTPSYVFNYVNQMEKRENQVLIRGGDEEVLSDLAAVLTFALPGYFDVEVSEVRLVTRTGTTRDESLPRNFLPRKFAGRLENTRPFVESTDGFLRDLISLKRENYVPVIRAIRTYKKSIRALAEDFDLSYSMLIYCFETLAQGGEAAEPRWEDLDDESRRRLDEALRPAPESVQAGARAAILQDRQLKLTQRFVDFIVNRLDDDFYASEARHLRRPIRRAEAPRAFRTAYGLRSKYTHTLELPMKHIRVPTLAEGEVFTWENQPYPTYACLARAFESVVRRLVRVAPKTEREAYNWSSEFPGIITMQLGAQHVVGELGRLERRFVRYHYHRFLEYMVENVHSSDGVHNLQAVMDRAIELMQTPDEDVVALLNIYWLYNGALQPELRHPRYGDVMTEYSAWLEKPDFPTLCTNAFFLSDPKFSAVECEKLLQTYVNGRFQRGTSRLPDPFEPYLALFVANELLTSGDSKGFARWCDWAWGETPSRFELQKSVREARDSVRPLDLGQWRKELFRSPTGEAGSEKA